MLERRGERRTFGAYVAQLLEQALGNQRRLGQKSALWGMQQQFDCLQELCLGAIAESVQLANLSAAGGLLQFGEGLDAQFVPQAANPLRAEPGNLEQLAQTGRYLASQTLE